MRKLIFKRDDAQMTVQSVPEPEQGARVVYLFHHCVAVEDEANQFGGWTDSPLTELGNSQADLMKDFIVNNGLKVNTLWSSDLPRAAQTAEHLVPATQSKSIIFTNRARSWGIGTEISGHVKTDQLYRDAKKFYVTNPDLVPPGEDAETLNQSKQRWMRFLMYVFTMTEPGNPNGIVAHGNNIKNTSQMLGFGKIKVGHGAICRLIMSKGGTLDFEVLFIPAGSQIGAEDDIDDWRKMVRSGSVYRMSAECVETRAE